jgi:eukaryotic-like serine/threonine-protein kinase
VQLEELKLLLPMEGDEADALFASFEEETDGTDLDRFLSWLYEKGHVGSETFRALHVHGDLSLVSLDEMAIAADADEGVDDRFKFLGVLGKGAMGEIHVARERDLRRKVALKFLLPERTSNRAIVRRFFREIQITAQLEHPNIVPIYALESEDDGTPACSMKLIQGSTLRTYIGEARALAEADKLDDDHALQSRLEHFLKVCDAIAYAHDRGILHRDLKPSNVMIGPYNEVYVMDWGIAKPLRSDFVDEPLGVEVGAWSAAGGVRDEGGAFQTRIGTVVGTPHYMSPEQARGDADLDERADQYALGLILHELVSLGYANPAEGATEALEAAMLGDVEPMTWPEKSGKLPPELVAIVDKSTAPERDDRYESVEMLADDLRRYLRGRAVRARPDTAMQATLRWISRNREKTLVLLALGLVLAFAGTTWGLLRERAVMADARAREEALGEALTSVATRAGQIDREFLRHQGLLEGLASAAVQALELEIDPEATFLLDEDFEDEARAPADLAFSPRYNKPVSVDMPVQVLAPGVDAASVRPLQLRLATLRDRYPALALRSDPDIVEIPTDERLRELVTTEGLPIVWSYVAVEEGVHAAWPGKAGYPDDYDPRQRPWYTLSAWKLGPRWGNPYLDSQGQGLLLPCTMALWDRTGSFRGVAGLELTFDWIVANLLELEGLPGIEESFLVDENGHVVVRSNYQEEGGPRVPDANEALRLPLFEEIEVVAEVLAGRSGYREFTRGGDDRLVAWYRMNALGWYYVVTADAEALLSIEAH